jgi:hypothetical protein
VVTEIRDPELEKASEKKAPTPADSPGPQKLAKSALERMTKPELVDFAADTYRLQLDEEEMTKDALVAAVLEAQG